jgi:thiol-disulfide isomerase/thioredoxin
MKKIILLVFCLVCFNASALEKKTTFSKELFNKAKSDGKIIVIHSWNKFCGSCSKQAKILKKAEKEFKDIVFFSYEQKNKNIADLLNIKYWTTIVIYKNDKEIYRSMGVTKEKEILSAIKSSI